MALPDEQIINNAEGRIPDPTATPFITYPSKFSAPPLNIGPLGGGGGFGDGNSSVLNKALFLTNPIQKNSRLNSGSFVTYNPNDIDLSGRYDRWMLGADNEDLSGKLQSGWDQAANGLFKGLGIAGTTFLQGTVGMAYGLGAAIGKGQLNKFYNNDFSNFMADLNKSMETALPNYYTAVERNANWYDPANWFTANFFWDKIIKNLGFSAGALASGAVVGGLLSKVPTLFGLSKAGMIGRVNAALEQGLAGVPQIERAAKAQSIIMQQAKTINAIEKLTAVERGVVAGLSAATEGGIEALQGLNDYRDKLIEQYKDTFGVSPTGEALNAINEKAEDLGNARFGLNTFLLTATNYIQLPRILGGSYSAGRNNFVNAVRNNFETGMLESALPTKTFPKLLYKAKNVAGLFFSPTEGFEEGAQYAIEKGVEAYYNKKDYSKDQSVSEFLNSFGEAAGEGIKKVADKEGMESILIGALSGGIQQSGLVGTYRTPDGKTSIGFGKSGELAERGFTGYGGALAKNTSELMKATPFTLKGDAWLKDHTDSVKRGIVLQDEFDKQIRQGDFLEAKDNQFDYQHNYLTPRIKHGRYDLVQDDINFYRAAGATQEGLDELKQKGIASELDTTESFALRLNNFENHAKLVKTLQETYKLTYGSFVDQATGKPLYSDEAIDKMVYATAKIADYDRRIPEISAKLLDAGIKVEEIVESVLTGKPESKQLVEDAFAKIAGIETPGLSETLKRDLRDVNELSIRRREFLKDYNDIKANPLKYTTKEATPATPTTTGETITVKTKDGEEQIVVGERYVGGAKEIKTNEGVTINRFTEFDVIGTNDKGGIVIKTLDGRLHNVSAKAFEEYKLTQSSKIGRNARFYIDNSDKIFNYRFKGGKEAKGYVVFDKNTRGLFFESIEKKKNGKPLYRIPVNLNQFDPQGEFTRAQIWSSERFSAATESLLQEAPTQEEVDIAANLEQKLNARRAIIKEISDDAKERIETIDKQIVSKKEELAKVNEDLKELAEVRVAEPRTKREKALEAKYPELSRQKVRFSKVFSTTSRALLKLARLKDSLESEIAQLEGERDSLDANVSYFEDFLQNMQELPENVFELVQELKDQVEGLKDLTKSTGKQIIQLNEMSDDINKTLKDLVKWLRDSLQKFDSEYPADIRERAQKIIESKTISFLEVNDLKNAVSDYALIQDLTKEISVNQGILNEVTDSLGNLMEKLDEIGKEQRAKELILKKFEELVEREIKRNEEEKAVARNEAVISQILGTMNQGVQNREYQRGYEPDARMSAVAAATSTSAPSEESARKKGETLAEHHYRANRFGARMPNLPNAGEIKGVIVTSATEGEIIPGLTNHLKQRKEEIKAETTIALVMAIPNKDGKGYTLVDENGAPITERAADESNEDYQNRVLNSAIYQTFPTNIESRFRESVPQEVRMKLVNSYDDWRKEKLAETTLKNYDVRPSFGFTEKVQQPTKDGLGFETDYNARVALQDSGLITEDDLGSRQLVYVPTTEETIALGSTSFTNALGRTFLVARNGYVPLNNRQHTAQEAETIHQVMVRLAEIIAEENKKGGFVYDNSLEAQRLVNWLRTVTYWGTPKEAAGYNSVWFQKTDDGLKLFMSGKTNEKGEYTPISNFTGTALIENKGIITGALQKMYLNTNAKATSADYYNERYEQITGVNEDGSVSFVMWPNYQSYLLSKKNADGSARKGEEIPLTTNIRPLKNSEDVNKYGIYFTIDEKNIDKRFTDTTPEGKAVTIQPEGKTAPKGKFTLDGKTENAVSIFSGEVELGKVRFTADESDLEGSVKILASTDESLINAIGQKLRDAGEADDPEVVFNTLAKFALKKIREDLAAVTQQQAPAPTVTPTAPTAAPVSDVEAKKADIERRRNEELDENLRMRETLAKDPDISDEDYQKIVARQQANAGKIDAKYDAELAALEGAKPAVETVTKDEDQQLNDAWNATEGNPDNPEEYRVILDDNYTETEDFAKFEEFLKRALPTVPVYRVKNMLRGANGVRAMGMFKKAAIYLWESAEVGTGYHEVFEAVWKMFTTPKEQQAIRNEFRNRSGQFKDRPSGQMIKYSEATDQQIKEQLAEEFRAYIKNGVIPPKPTKTKPFILKLFADIWATIKALVIGSNAQSNTERLFEKINKGYYRRYTGLESAMSYANAGIIDIEDATITDDAELSEIPGFTNSEVHDFMQQMTFLAVGYLTRDNKSLFNVSSDLTKADVYGKIQANLMETFKKISNIEKERVKKGEITQEAADQKEADMRGLFNKMLLNWDSLLENHEIYLRKYGIEFDENDEMNVRDENNTGRGEYDGAHKVDHFRKMNIAVRLVLATMPILDNNGKPILSPIGGVKLLPVGQTYISIMNRVHDSVDADDMMNRIREMAKEDTNYETLYRRLAKASSEDLPNWDAMEVDDIKLVTAFSAQFTKQNPEVKVLNILPVGGVQVGEANLTTASRQLERNYVNGIKTVAMKPDNKFFEYNFKEKAYIAKPGAFDGVRLTEDPATYVKFLANVGIEFDINDVINLSVTNPALYTRFREATSGVLKSFKERKKIVSFSDQALDIKGRLLTLGGIQARISNPEFSSTFYGVSGEKLQTFMGTNPSFDLYKELSKFPTYESLNGHPRFGYLYTDSFAQNSVILNAIFNINKDTKTGSRRQGAEAKEYMKPGVANGTINQVSGKKKESSRLNFRERLIQEINMNLDGYYYNLVAGDASLEYMTYMGNEIKNEDLDPGKTIVQEIFRGYLIDEINLARENRPTVKSSDSEKLRFMDAILGSELANDLLSEKDKTAEQIYEDNKTKIDNAVEKYINNSTESFKKVLTQYGIISEEADETFEVSDLAFAKTGEASKEVLDRNLKRLNINYIIANIEFHKLLYSDPYMYKDELKRIKNFLSPRQAIVSSGNVNTVLNKVYNQGYTKDDIGYTDMTQTYFKSTTITDIQGIIDLENYDAWDEADGAGIIAFKAHRNLRIRANNWSDADEAQYRYDVAWEKQHKKLPVSKAEQRILDQGNPRVKSAYTPTKPIVAGSRADGKSYNDVMLDKFALFPLSYRVAVEMAELAGQKTSNAVRLYNKMQAEGLDYAVFKSARKVGGTVTNDIYDENGVITQEPFKGVMNVPFSIISIQTEVPSKEDNLVTRGSQMTKLATMDMMEAGVPIDFMRDEKDFNKRMEAWYKIPSETEKKKASPLYAEIKNNEALLNALTEEGYNIVLKKLGITEKDGKLSVTDFSKAAKTLRDEIFRREVNSNIIKTLADFLNGKAILEATPAYQQVRNVLYSIVDKNIASPKMSGGQKVQAPSTFLEDIRATKVKGGYSSDVLKFYEDKDGERYCEIMVGRWFDSPLSDKELMDYFNNTEEGKKELAAMMGVAYRIPTGKQNYIEHYRIKQFLPAEMGDTVIVPSALVKKVGSDFDIDKLNVYLKNVYVKNGKPKVIPFFGIGEEAKQKLQKTILKEDLENIFKLDQEFPEVYDVSYDSLYKKSLENAYIESLEKLTSHELNFKQLITPNSSDLLKGLSQKITKKLGVTPFESAAIGNILDRGFMSSLRHAFVTGKYAIGIAAVAQTNHSLNQRQPTFVDTRKLKNLTERDRPWVKDGKLKFEKFNKIKIGGELFTSLSGIKDAANKSFISDIIGQFIDGYVDISKGPWIIELGANPNVAGTFLFLAKAGVPIEDVVYFMNQPIVRDYLRSLENSGQSYLFIDDNVEEIKNKYKVAQSKVDKITKIPSATKLFENIGKTEFDAQEKAEQQFILDEFLKYSKLAEQLLMVQQGTNYDTSTLNDPMLVFKKNELYKRAKTSMISSAEDLMKNSFMGKLREFMNKSRDAVANFLASDRGRVRSILEDVLAPYVMLNDRDFLAVSRKAVNTFFDWAVQVSQNRNTFIESLLLSDKNAASQVLAFKNEIAQDENHPLYNNYIIGKNGILQTITPNKAGGVNNISVNNKENKAYDQDQIIYSFRELRDHLDSIGNLQLYKKIVGVSILQSGLSTTPYSFTSLLPYEDFVEIYNDAIYKLEMSSELDINKFYELGVFQRNNWQDDDIVPQQRAKISGYDMYGYPIYNQNMNFSKMAPIQKAINNGEIPKLLKISTLSNAGRQDFVSYSWEKVPEGKSKAQMRKDGDFSYIKKGLFKKVYYDKERTKPVTTSFTKKLADGTTKTFTSYVYQMVNAWGDSFRANELYDVARESVIDNGYEKVVTGQYQVKGSYMGQSYEVTMQTSPERNDQAVARLFGAVVETTPTQAPAVVQREYTPEKLTKANMPANGIFVFGSNTEGRHGLGAAETAKKEFGAIQGQAEGLQGQSYAIITKDLAKGKRSIPLYGMDGNSIAEKVRDFVEFANSNPQLKFYVTKLGSKLAGYSIEEIKSIFDSVNKLYITQDIENYIPNNVVLPEEYEVRDAKTRKQIAPEGLPSIDDNNQNTCG